MILRLFIVVAVLWSAAAAAQNHPYWPTTPGTVIDYQVFQITGVYHPASLVLDVLTRTPYPGDDKWQSVVTLPVNTLQPIFARVQFKSAAPVPEPLTANPHATLTGGLWKPFSGPSWMGEQINQIGSLQIPPLPLLAMDTVPGPIMSGVSDITNYGPDGTTTSAVLPWKYRTISNGPWGAHQDTVRTGFLEAPAGAHHTIYNYIFVRGKGMMDYWWGQVVSDNTVTGYQMYGLRVRP